MSETLDGMIKVLSGWAFPSGGFNQINGLPLIRIRDLGRETTEVKFEGRYDDRYVVQDGDVLIGMDGDFTVKKWNGGLALLNQRVCKVKSITQELDQGFLYWYLIPHVAEIHRKTPQTTVRHLSAASLYEIVNPPIPACEQRVVSLILDTLDSTIHQTEAIIEKLKQVKQGLLHDLLTRGIDANGELRPPQSQAPHLYKDSSLGWVPNEWMVELLDNVAERGSGHTPSKSAPSYWNGGIKWVSLADSHRLDHIYITDTDKEISELGLANSSAVRHQAGTVILSRDAGVGKSAILAIEMAVSQHFIAWRCGEKLNNLYLYFMLQRMKPIFESIAIGSTIKTIGLTFFKKLTIVVPSRAEQDRIVGVILSNEAALQTHSVELGKLRLQKDGLLDDLLTGRVRVTPLLNSPGA